MTKLKQRYEQLARNNLSDWNGPLRSELKVLTLFFPIPRVYAFKKTIRSQRML